MPDNPSLAEQTSKVAAITLVFWIMKVVTTTVGDLSGDLLSLTLGLGYYLALAVALAVMAAVLGVQLRTQRASSAVYWALMLLSSTVGAEVSDSLDRALHWGALGGAGLLLGCLLATLAIWRLNRGEIRIYPIHARAALGFYWLAAIFANSLGSAIGDLVGDRLGFGVLGGVVLNAAVLALLTILYYTRRASRTGLFWTAFVFSRISF